MSLKRFSIVPITSVQIGKHYTGRLNTSSSYLSIIIILFALLRLQLRNTCNRNIPLMSSNRISMQFVSFIKTKCQVILNKMKNKWKIQFMVRRNSVKIPASSIFFIKGENCLIWTTKTILTETCLHQTSCIGQGTREVLFKHTLVIPPAR